MLPLRLLTATAATRRRHTKGRVRLALHVSFLWAAVLTSGAGVAQRPSAFTDLPLPAGASSAALVQLGKIASYDAGPALYAYSAHTRRWTSVSKSPNAILRQANDWFLLADGQLITALSYLEGLWRGIQVSASSTIINPPSQVNDSMVLVRDGNQIHAFSGFTGKWVSKTLPNSATVVVQRHTALAVDGTTLWGLGAFDMVWRSRSMNAPATRVFVDSFGGFAEAGTEVYGYSAQTRSFASATLPAGTLTRGATGDVAIWQGGPQALGWSALRGSFASALVGTGVATVEVERQVGIVAVPQATHFYSAPLGTWTQAALPATATRMADSTTVLVVEPTAVHAYSAWRGTIASQQQAVVLPAVSRAVASAQIQSSGLPLLYSAVTGQWHAVPLGTSAQVAAISVHAAIVATTSGFAAFSARDGSFSALPAASGTVLHDPATAILGVLEPTRLSLFEERAHRWHSVPLAGPVNPARWRLSLLANDGLRLIGFGAQTGLIEEQVIPQTALPLALRASSELATGLYAKGIWAYSALPDLVTASQFPEFRRIFLLGNALPLFVAAPTSSLVATFAGARAATPLATPFGDLHVDLASFVPGPALTTINGSASVEIMTPSLTSLLGIDVVWQGLVLPPTARAYLTRPTQSLLR